MINTTKKVYFTKKSTTNKLVKFIKKNKLWNSIVLYKDSKILTCFIIKFEWTVSKVNDAVSYF